MAISVSLMAAIYRAAYEVWLSVATGYWETASTWQKGVAPSTNKLESVHIINYTVADDGTKAAKQNKTIVVDTSGIFNPVATTYAYGGSLQTTTGMFTGSKITLQNGGFLKLFFTSSNMGGDVIVSGTASLAVMGSFSGPTLNSLGGSGSLNLYGDNPGSDAYSYVYPLVGTLSCTDNLTITCPGGSLGTSQGNMNLLVSTALNVPAGKTLSFGGSGGLQIMQIQSGCTVNVAGTMRSGDHTYNDSFDIFCAPANLTGGGLLDAQHGNIRLDVPGYNVANLGTNISFRAGTLQFVNYPSSGYVVDLDLIWNFLSPGGIGCSAGNLSPTLTFRQLNASEDGSHSTAFGNNDSGGLCTVHIKSLTADSTVTYIAFNTYNAPNNIVVIDAATIPVGCTLDSTLSINFTANISLGGSLSTHGPAVFNVPSGVTLTVKSLTINYGGISPGTYTANTLTTFSGTGTVVVTG